MVFTYSVNTQGPNKWVVVYGDGNVIYTGAKSFSATEAVLIQEAILATQGNYPGVQNMTAVAGTSAISTGSSSTNTLSVESDPIPPVVPLVPATSGSTFIDGPDTSVTDAMIKQKEDLKSKIVGIQSVGLPGIKDVTKTLWDNSIKPNLLTPRQVCKKMVMMQGKTIVPIVYEEQAQYIVYGKKYYKNGKLYDNDAADPACVSQKTDEDYIPPMDENHPMWQKILQMIKDLEENLIQMGIKLGEFTVALPAAIATIAVSLIALVSSVIILPFGSGIPTAITAVQTMIKAIKQLQQKTAEILPLLAVIDTVSLLLPKSAQGVIAQINIIFGLFLIIITGLSAILGLLGGASSAVSKSQTKMASIPLASAPSASPSSVTQGQSVKLSANASGSDYNYTYQWTDANGNVIAKDPAMVDDDGTRTVTPNIPLIVNPLITIPATTTYTCKVTDGAGTIKTSTVTITRI